jgi:hypothetical protein
MHAHAHVCEANRVNAYTSQFLNAAQTQIQRSDGLVFTIERRQHPSTIGGFAGEQFRSDGCKVVPFGGGQAIPPWQFWESGTTGNPC